MDLKGKKILFLGDSITEGYGLECTGERYADLIGKNEGAVCVNYGVSGTRIANQHIPGDPAHEYTFIERVDAMEDNADIVFVFGGTNDFGHGDAAMGEFYDKTPDTFYGALHTLFTKLINKYPSSTIVVATPLHRLEENNYIVKDGARRFVTLAQYVSAIREVAEYYSLPLLDLYASSGLQPKLDIIREKYMPDGLHPNKDGHILLASRISAFLKSL